jgi:hypothetical protein
MDFLWLGLIVVLTALTFVLIGVCKPPEDSR